MESPLFNKNIDSKEILVFSSINQISDFALQKWLEISEVSIRKKGRFAAALSGGDTPATLYRRLAEYKGVFPWDRTELFLVDERFVPFDDPASNYRMIDELLISRIRIPGENIHLIPTDSDSPEAAADEYNADLVSSFRLKEGCFPEFDLMMLGIGEDGHTASLFPDTSAINETGRNAVSVSPADISTNIRISITLPVINNSENIFFLVTGREKSKIIKEVIENRNCRLPAAMVAPENGRLFFLIDENAASDLS